MRSNTSRLIPALVIVIPMVASPQTSPRNASAINAFRKQVDRTLITKEFSFKRLGAVSVDHHLVNVYLYESTFSESERVTRRLVFMGSKEKFLGMYGNFADSPTLVKENKIYFEPDPAYKDQQYILVPRSGLHKQFQFRGDDFSLFGFKE